MEGHSAKRDVKPEDRRDLRAQPAGAVDARGARRGALRAVPARGASTVRAAR